MRRVAASCLVLTSGVVVLVDIYERPCLPDDGQPLTAEGAQLPPADRPAVTRRVSDRRAGGGEFRADEHQRCLRVVRLGNGRESELGDRARTEDEAVS